MALEKEIAFFERIKDDLLKNHAGKFALIYGEELLGSYDTAQHAYEEGIRLVGTTEAFLVKQVIKDQPVEQLPALTLGLLHARF